MTTAIRSPDTVRRVPRPLTSLERSLGEFKIQEIRDRNIQRWTRLLDETLIPWGQDPATLEDDGVRAPSKDTIHEAYLLGLDLRGSGSTPPTHIVAGPNGEIIFEFKVDDTTSETYELTDDGTLEYCRVRDGKVQRRETFGQSDCE